jgi:hypothetical protein
MKKYASINYEVHACILHASKMKNEGETEAYLLDSALFLGGS